MRPYPPSFSVIIREQSALERLITEHHSGVSAEHLAYSGQRDKINEVRHNAQGGYDYYLFSIPLIWPHATLRLGESGRALVVNEARPREERPHGRFGGPRSFGKDTKTINRDKLYDSTKSENLPSGKMYSLYVGGLPYNLSDQNLLRHFVRYGEVKQAQIVIDTFSGRSCGFGFVGFSDPAAAQLAIQGLNNQEMLDTGDLASAFDVQDLSSKLDEQDLPGKSEVLQIIEAASKELAILICNEPGKLEELEWRDLERMLAVVFNGIGFETQLTRPAKDGGKDIVISFMALKGRRVYYVEIKHWISGKRVAKDTIKEFVSVIVREQVGGILISTSGFTTSATEGITEIERKRLRLGDKSTIVSLCRLYTNVGRGLFQPVDYNDIIMSHTR